MRKESVHFEVFCLSRLAGLPPGENNGSGRQTILRARWRPRDDGAAVNGLVEAKRLFGATSLPAIVVGRREGACDMTSGSATAVE